MQREQQHSLPPAGLFDELFDNGHHVPGQQAAR
jgi:hypothetical protein